MSISNLQDNDSISTSRNQYHHIDPVHSHASQILPRNTVQSHMHGSGLLVDIASQLSSYS
jgi:hypothetical protein